MHGNQGDRIEKKVGYSTIRLYGQVIILIAKEVPFLLTFIIVLALIDGLLPIINFLLLKNIIDSIVYGFNGNRIPFWYIVAGWSLLLLAQYAISPITNYCIELSNNRVVRLISSWITNKALSFSGVSHLEDKGYQELSQWVNFVNAPAETFLYQLSDILRYAVQFGSVFYIFSVLELWMPIILIISVLPSIFSSWKIASVKSSNQEEINDLERKILYYRSQLLSSHAIKELKLFSFHNLFQKKLQSLFAETELKKNRVSRISIRYTILSMFIRALFVGLVFLVLALRARDGQLSAGSLALYFQSIYQFSTSLFQIITIWSYTKACNDFFTHLFQYLRLEDNIDLSQSVMVLEGPITSIRFNNVSFAYPSGTKALEDVTFELKKGDSLAIVGENGAGKTTLVKLLCRLYDVSCGSIEVNGLDIRTIDLKSYRDRISALFQDYGKYSLTLEENIYADSGKPCKEDKHTLEYFSNIILKKLPNGYATLLGSELGGVDLSGGEWQRVAIARGFAKKHDILIVDEPTASIDPIEETHVFKGILKMDSNITIIVTHRLGSIKHVRQILVLKDGRKVAEGNHDALLQGCHYYNKLYRSQADQYEQSQLFVGEPP
jgi:ATP-binding cassette, subfamily B, bacterial